MMVKNSGTGSRESSLVNMHINSSVDNSDVVIGRNRSSAFTNLVDKEMAESTGVRCGPKPVSDIMVYYKPWMCGITGE
jgi:hypothetical protein